MANTSKHKEAQKKWYDTHQSEISQKRRGARSAEHRAYYIKVIAEKGHEFVNEAARRWRKANPEKVKQILAKSRKSFPERRLLNSARARAKKSGFLFNLELSDIIIPERCPLLSVDISPCNTADYCPSLDRIDNTKGYIKGNVWVISFKANKMKNAASLEELHMFAQNYLSLHNSLKDI